MTERPYDGIGRSDQEETDAYEESFPEIMNHLGTVSENDLDLEIIGGKSV